MKPSICPTTRAGRSVLLVLCAAAGMITLKANSQEKSDLTIVDETGRAKASLTAGQRLGLRMLDSAQSEASATEPDVRAFVLWQASYGRRKLDPDKAAALLKDAFLATLSINKSQEKCMTEAELCGSKYWLQKTILQDVIDYPKQIHEIDSLLAAAEPGVRQMITHDLFQHYVAEKEAAKASSLLNQIAEQDGYFCYGCAEQLMDVLRRSQWQERNEIFSQAVEAYSRHPDEKFPTPDDFAMMVLHSWRDLDPSSVLGAIDKIFDRAKEADQEQRNTRVGISAMKGDAYFSSVYAFRLYQLMPVLDQLDQSRAAGLLRENREVQIALEQYPQSLQSMNALAESDTQAGKRRTPRIFSIGTVDNAQAGAEEYQNEINRQKGRILDSATKDPKQALSAAMGLPLSSGSGTDYSPRASALISLAQIVAASDSTVAKAALEDIRTIAVQMPLRSQALILEQVPELYLTLGDPDDARDTLDELVKIAEKLYRYDSDVNDPNQAFKGMWPSVNVWRRCVSLAAKLASTRAEEIIQGIPDPDIRALERITFANSLLGASTRSLSTVEKHKTGIVASIR